MDMILNFLLKGIENLKNLGIVYIFDVLLYVFLES